MFCCLSPLFVMSRSFFPLVFKCDRSFSTCRKTYVNSILPFICHYQTHMCVIYTYHLCFTLSPWPSLMVSTMINCPYQPTIAFALSSDFPDSQSSWAVLILHFLKNHSLPLDPWIMCCIWSISSFGFYDTTLPLVFSASLKKPFLLDFVVYGKAIQADAQRPRVIILILLSKYRVNTVSVNIYGMLVNFWSILKSFDYCHYCIVLYGGSGLSMTPGPFLPLIFPRKC